MERYNYGLGKAENVAMPQAALDMMDDPTRSDTDIWNNAALVMDLIARGASSPTVHIPYSQLVRDCLGKTIAVDPDDVDDPINGTVSQDEGVNADKGGFTFMYIAGTGDTHPYYQQDHCADLENDDSSYYDPNFVRVATYVGFDYSTIMASASYLGSGDSITRYANSYTGFGE